MKRRLAVLRHAKSSWDEDLDDFDRPLDDRGRKAARQVGQEIKRRDMRFDSCLASPAVRVRETLERLQRGFGDFSFAVRFEPSLYSAGLDTLLYLARALPDESEAPLLVGHNPGLELLVASLSRDDSQGLRARAADKFPTGALAVIELPAQRWTDVEEGSGTVAELILPRDLD